MLKDKLEQHQVWFYLLGILLGLLIGLNWPGLSGGFELALWPVLGCLLYATFTQVPLVQLRQGLTDLRFLSAIVVGNFVVIPLVVWILLLWVPGADPIVLGVLLVLLVPCTDWFISFTHLARGDTSRAIVATPLLLLIQIAALPFYLWVFMGERMVNAEITEHLVPAFVGLILFPLLLAWLTERWALKQLRGRSLIHKLSWAPVPLLTVVVFLIAGAQIQAVLSSGSLLLHLTWIYLAFLVLAAIVGLLLARWFRLPSEQSITLIFSLGTRNSFVVLPLAIALPELWSAAVVVIVFQSLVELFGMMVYLKVIPRLSARFQASA